jgi:selenide,water dikinase
LVAQDVVPGGTKRNLAYVEEFVTFAAAVDAGARLVLADAQTSGGLLLAVAPQRAGALARMLERNGVPVVAEIGEIIAGVAGRIDVVA